MRRHGWESRHSEDCRKGGKKATSGAVVNGVVKQTSVAGGKGVGSSTSVTEAGIPGEVMALGDPEHRACPRYRSLSTRQD